MNEHVLSEVTEHDTRLVPTEPPIDTTVRSVNVRVRPQHVQWYGLPVFSWANVAVASSNMRCVAAGRAP